MTPLHRHVCSYYHVSTWGSDQGSIISWPKEDMLTLREDLREQIDELELA